MARKSTATKRALSRLFVWSTRLFVEVRIICFIATTNAARDSGHSPKSLSRAQPVAHFKAISARIFKENGVVAGFIIHRTFDVSRARACGDFRDSVNVRRAFSPERY